MPYANINLKELVGEKTKDGGEIFNDYERNIAAGKGSHAEGKATYALSAYQHAQGKYNIGDSQNKYAHIVGNGTDGSNRSNAHTLDWDGNAWYAKDVYIGGFQQSEGKKLATEEFIESKLNMKVNIDRVQIIESQILNIDYNTILAFNTSEIVGGQITNTTAILGQATLDSLILA